MAADTLSGKDNGAEMKQTYRAVKNDVRDLGRDVGHLAQTVGDEAKVRARDLSETVRARSEDAFASLQSQVREKPGMALGIAAGAGLLIGLLMARR
ncbi:MAG: DUF883 family protein [Alphaproteobacteria bacterium]|nr:DUF883 family protein [Alphaproteobacteria bacterium]